MVVTCVIDFDNNPAATYFAGQVATGKITLNSNKAKNVKGVALKINGFAHTNWTETYTTTVPSGNGATTTVVNTVNYVGHEDYIASKTYLLGSSESQSLVIEPGIHTYTFAFHIPIACPTSFEGQYGHVRYTVRVVLVRPWKFNQSFTKGLTVLKLMDLNYDSPLLRMPSHVEIQKTYWCGPCRSDPLKLQLSLQQSGYVPGQTIPVSLLVTNDSRIPVEEIKVELVMVICYYSQTPSTKSRSQRIVVSKLKKEGVPQHCNKLFHYDMTVPATPPTCFNLCRIIQIAYHIEVEAKVKGTHRNQKVVTPVTIGNVPLMGVVQQQPTSSGMMRQQLYGGNDSPHMGGLKSVELHAVSLNEAYDADEDCSAKHLEVLNMPVEPSAPNPWAADPTIPPPSYGEATHMQAGKINADEGHDYGESDFSPRYLVFNIPSPTAPTDGADESDGVAALPNGNSLANKSTWL